MAHRLLDVFMPRNCVHCGEGIEDSEYSFICAQCAREIFPCLPPACTTCGYPFYGSMSGPQVCPHCHELDPVFDEGKALFLAKGPGRSIIHELKYSGGFYLLPDLAKMIATTPHYRRYLENATLVPVPLHSVKLRERGYNQSERIARMLCLASGTSTNVENLLQRTVFTRTQTKLNRTERHRNVKNAFALAPDTVLIPDHQYILVDDVFTTGSTLNACARVLRSAGATRLKVVTLGHG